MKCVALLCIVTCVFGAELCAPPTDNCGTIALNSDSVVSQDLTVFSETNYKGEVAKINITWPYGCTNDVPSFRIKSMISTGSTQVTLHYGKDCVGHVLKQYQGGSDNIDETDNCPGSIFVKHNRYGSC